MPGELATLLILVLNLALEQDEKLYSTPKERRSQMQSVFGEMVGWLLKKKKKKKFKSE